METKQTKIINGESINQQILSLCEKAMLKVAKSKELGEGEK